MDDEDIWKIRRAGPSRLLFEAAQSLGIAANIGPKQLDHHVAGESASLAVTSRSPPARIIETISYEPSQVPRAERHSEDAELYSDATPPPPVMAVVL
jgi:hypothetical protein